MGRTLHHPIKFVTQLLRRLRRPSARERFRETPTRLSTGVDIASEQFKLLALNVLTMLEGSSDRSLTVFSPHRGDGRSTVAANLGVALAAHTEVLLVDGGSSGRQADLQLPPASSSESKSALVQKGFLSTHTRGLWLLPGDQPVIGGALTAHIQDAKRDGMFVVMDAPAASQSADAFVLAQKGRNVLYVMRNRNDDESLHQQMLDHLRRLEARVLGIVLNDN